MPKTNASGPKPRQKRRLHSIPITSLLCLDNHDTVNVKTDSIKSIRKQGF